jgi:hypothetical protein
MNTDHHLDDLLRAWGETQRLPDDRAEEIRLAIVGQPAQLPATWWRDFSAQLTATVVHAGGQANRAAWPPLAVPAAA